MLSLKSEQLVKCLFVSPVLNMEHLISKMMIWANVTDEQLERQLTISTDFGQTLSWDYLLFARRHPVSSWSVPTEILYGDMDNLIELSDIETFSQTFDCKVTIMKGGEHWFHTPEQLSVLNKWIEKCFRHS